MSISLGAPVGLEEGEEVEAGKQVRGSIIGKFAPCFSSPPRSVHDNEPDPFVDSGWLPHSVCKGRSMYSPIRQPQMPICLSRGEAGIWFVRFCACWRCISSLLSAAMWHPLEADCCQCSSTKYAGRRSSGREGLRLSARAQTLHGGGSGLNPS